MEHLPNPRAKLHPESSTKADLPANSSRNRSTSDRVCRRCNEGEKNSESDGAHSHG